MGTLGGVEGSPGCGGVWWRWRVGDWGGVGFTWRAGVWSGEWGVWGWGEVEGGGLGWECGGGLCWEAVAALVGVGWRVGEAENSGRPFVRCWEVCTGLSPGCLQQ